MIEHNKFKKALESWDTLIDMGPGENQGCLVEPEIFKSKVAALSDDEIRNMLEALDSLLEKHRRYWRTND